MHVRRAVIAAGCRINQAKKSQKIVGYLKKVLTFVLSNIEKE
jgi:hypothetical protein